MNDKVYKQKVRMMVGSTRSVYLYLHHLSLQLMAKEVAVRIYRVKYLNFETSKEDKKTVTMKASSTSYYYTVTNMNSMNC